MATFVKLDDTPRPLISNGYAEVGTTGTYAATITGGVEATYGVRTLPHVAMTEEEALLAAQQSADIPATYGNFPARAITIAERRAPWYYIVKVKWSPVGSSAKGGVTAIKRTYSTVDFSTHITQGLDETVYAPSGGQTQSVSGYINVTETDVNGTDRQNAYLQMTEVHNKPASLMTQAYISIIAERFAGKYVNNAAFRGWSAGEVQLSSCQIGEAAGGYVPVTFVFNVGKNLTNIAIPGSTITVASKGAFQYLWTRTVKQQSNMRFYTIDPSMAYVNTIYESTDFSFIDWTSLPTP